MIILKNFATFSKEDNSFVAIYKDCNVQKIDNNNIWGIEISEELANRRFNKYTLDDNKNLIIIYDNEAELNYIKTVKIQEIINYYQSDELRGFKIIKDDIEISLTANQNLSDDLDCNIKSLLEKDKYYTYYMIGGLQSIDIPKDILLDINQKVQSYRKMIKINEQDHVNYINTLQDIPAINNYNYTTDFRNGGEYLKFQDINLNSNSNSNTSILNKILNIFK